MDELIYIGIFLACVFVSSCSQILLKIAADKGYKGLRAYFNMRVIAGYSIFLLVSFTIVFLYRYVELSTGVLLDASSYIFIPLLSFFMLGERLSKKKIIGLLFVISGLITGALL
jgi:drug/metabolite transporter (DMT)-like permease